MTAPTPATAAPQRKAALVLAASAAVGYLVAVILLLRNPPDGGADIGAGGVLLLSLLCSVVGAGLLIASPGRVATRTGVTSLLLWVAYLALAVDDTGPRWLAMGLGGAAVLTLLGGALLEVRRRPVG